MGREAFEFEHLHVKRVRVGSWLSVERSKRLLASASRDSLRGKRNYAMLATLLGCGFRHGKLLVLQVESIQLREEHWVIADLPDKAGHVCTVPIPGWVKAAIDEWKEASGITGGALCGEISCDEISLHARGVNAIQLRAKQPTCKRSWR